MKYPLSARYSAGSLVIAVSLLLLPVGRAQRPAKPAPAPTTQAAAAEKSPAVTFDTLLSADAYGIYAEMRMVGQHAGSQEIAGLIQPLTLSGGAPDELLELYEFIKAHAEPLTTARLMLASMPARAGLPEMLVAVEMPSVEAAQKFVPELKGFVAAHLAPAPPNRASLTMTTGATEDTPRPARRRGKRRARTQATGENAPEVVAGKLPAAPPLQIKRSGNIIAMSNTAFTFKSLHGKDQAMLVDEPGFQAARTRFSTDTLFVYFNTVRMNNSSKQRMEALEKEHQRQVELARAEASKQGAEESVNASSDISSTTRLGRSSNANVAIVSSEGGNMNMNTGTMSVSPTPADEIPPPTPEATPTPKSEKELEEERQREQSLRFAEKLAQFVFRESPGSSSGWPESIGVGASLEGDSIVLRGLFVSPSDDEPLRPIPFLPVVLSGPSITTGATAVLPADTDIFASVSLDLPQMYDYLASMIKILDLAATASEENKDGPKGGFAEQLTSFEKTNNFRIKEELLAALGNEIAIGMPGQLMFGNRAVALPAQGIVISGSGPPAAAPPQTGPIVVMALNDKESFQKLLPRVLTAIGFAGVSEQSIIEKHGEVEVLTFSRGTLAFIDRFLVSTPDAATMRRVTDAYNGGETLANSTRFRDSVNWQSKQAIGQVYVSNAMLKNMFGDVSKDIEDIDDEAVRAYLRRLDPDPGALTHIATRESNGLMHEIHLPKNLLSLFTASAVVSQKLALMRSNESMAQWKLQMIANAQNQYKQTAGRYGTNEDLIAAGHFNEEYDSLEVGGYEIKHNVSGDKFEATATPTGYPKQGRRSYYIDQTGLLRGGDLKGKPASATDPQLGY